MNPAPITVGIPTYARGAKVVEALEHVLACRPAPAEVIVHVDQSDGSLEELLRSKFPGVKLLSSPSRVGPGGGRHRCLSEATQPIFASFDDDSWPIDEDYFGRVEAHFTKHPEAACLAAVIFQRNQPCPEIELLETVEATYTGCGYAIRVSAYRGISGHVDRCVPYGIEEIDLSLQLHGAGWKIVECGDLRVFHDTVLAHHTRPDITAGTIENAILLPWLRYPVLLWPYGLLQLGNVILFMLKSGRFAGIATGLLRAPLVPWKHFGLRRPLPAGVVWSYLQSRPAPDPPPSKQPQ